MAHFGVISPPVSGHLNPFGALGRELCRRGHRVTVFHLPDLEKKVREQQLEFSPIGQTSFPANSLPPLLHTLGRSSGLSALRFTMGLIRRTTEMFCRDAPEALRLTKIDFLLVDQTEPAGATVADRLGLPYATLCMALALNREDGVPPPFINGFYAADPLRRMFQRVEYGIWDWLTRSVRQTVNDQRMQWKLPVYRCL